MKKKRRKNIKKKTMKGGSGWHTSGQKFALPGWNAYHRRRGKNKRERKGLKRLITGPDWLRKGFRRKSVNIENPSFQIESGGPVLGLEGLKETEIQALKGLDFIYLEQYLIQQGFTKREIYVLEKTIKLNGEHLFKDGNKKGSLIVNPNIKNDITGFVYDLDTLAEKLSKLAQYILNNHEKIISEIA